MTAIVEANRTRKDHIANMVMKRNPKTVGVYRLTMKKNSDNFRESAILDIIMKLKKYSMKIIIYEPELKEDTFYNLEVVKDINEFKQRSELIITNRMHEELKDVKNKVYTRDLYERD